MKKIIRKNQMKDSKKPNQQLIKQNKSIGLVKGKFSDNKIKIYEAYRGLKRIRDFKSNDELKPLIDLVGKWRYYIGIKEELSQEELFMNVTFIRENFRMQFLRSVEFQGCQQIVDRNLVDVFSAPLKFSRRLFLHLRIVRKT